MSKIANQELYDKVKKDIYDKYPKHSAYRSSLLVQEYKRRGGVYIAKKDSNKGLAKWHKETWLNQRGEEVHKNKSDV